MTEPNEETTGYFDDDVSDLPEWKQKARLVPMGVDNTGLLVQQAYSKGLPMQFDRELVKNAIEASATTIRIYPDWIGVEDDGVYRYVIADNGSGMTGPELAQFFNKLSSSGKFMDEHGNYGIGAKISLLPWNQRGIVVMSWKAGVGAMVKIVRDSETGNYALAQWRVDPDSDRFSDYVEPPEEYKPDWMGQSGTVVLALGNTADDDTYMGPTLKPSSAKVHREALNSRFFAIPDGVDLRVFEFGRSDKSSWPKTPSETRAFQGWQAVLGAKHYLEKAKADSGFIELTDARVHWWVLKPPQQSGPADESQRSRVSGYAPDSGLVAALYDGELYDLLEGGAARTRHQQFGIIWPDARKNITLIVEPRARADGKAPSPDASRRTLLYPGGEEMPWTRWGEEFIRLMPAAIKDELSRREPASSIDNDKLAEKLREYADRFRFESVKPANDGAVRGNPGASGGAGAGPRNVETGGKRRKRRRRPAGRSFLEQSGDGSATGNPLIPGRVPPAVRWEEGQDDDFRGRAAEYVPSLNVVKINWEFSAFQEAFDYWCGVYAQSNDAPAAIKRVIQEVYGLELASRVYHSFAFEGRVGWQGEFTEGGRLLSPEALTLATLGIIGVEHSINTKLGGVLKGLTRKPSRRTTGEQ